MRRRCPFLALVLSVGGPLSPVASPQNVVVVDHMAGPIPSPRIAAGLNSVVVDVVVTDDDNRPVKGLTAQDFRVLENGKPQAILAFQAPDELSDDAIGDAVNRTENRFTNAGSSALAYFNVVLLDQLNTSIQNQALALRELNTFFVHKPPNAAFAIFSLRNDDIACKPYQQNRWIYGSTVVEIPDWDSGCTSGGKLLLVQGFTTDKDRLMAAIQGSDNAQPHVTWLRVQLPLGGGGRCGFPVGYDALDYYNRGPAEVKDTTMPALAELGNFLHTLPGRKSLIWMSDNFDAAPIPQPSDMWFPPKFRGWENTDVFSQIQMTHLTASRIAQARVAIYPVDLTGKNKGVDVKRIAASAIVECFSSSSISNPLCRPNSFAFSGFSIPSGSLFASPGVGIVPKMPSLNTCDEHGPKLDNLAKQTGGRAFHKAENIQHALAEAVSDEADYYTLSYSPSKTKLDGKRREINVIVDGRDYHLKYRETYFADDPSLVNPPEGSTVADVSLPNPTGPMPWIPLRIPPPDPSHSGDSQDPILFAMKYAKPEANGIVFSAHVEPAPDFAKATPEQMEQLRDYESFKAERIAKAMENLTREEMKKRHKGHLVLGELGSLPSPEPVLLQPYSIDYFIPVKQLDIKEDATGKNSLTLAVAVLAFDALGKKVTGLEQTLDISASASDLSEMQSSDYHLSQKIDVPDRVTLLRLAVRDLSGGKVGSLEIPIWAVQSPYRRKRLVLPMGLEKSSAEQGPLTQDSTH